MQQLNQQLCKNIGSILYNGQLNQQLFKNDIDSILYNDR